MTNAWDIEDDKLENLTHPSELHRSLTEVSLLLMIQRGLVRSRLTPLRNFLQCATNGRASSNPIGPRRHLVAGNCCLAPSTPLGLRPPGSLGGRGWPWSQPNRRGLQRPSCAPRGLAVGAVGSEAWPPAGATPGHERRSATPSSRPASCHGRCRSTTWRSAAPWLASAAADKMAAMLPVDGAPMDTNAYRLGGKQGFGPARCRRCELSTEIQVTAKS